MFAVSALKRDLNQIFTEAQNHSTADNLQHLCLFFEKAMTMTATSRFKSEAFLHRPKARDETLILNELPGILMRVFRTEYDKRDEKFPSWLDIIDHNLHEHRTQVSQEDKESFNLSRLSNVFGIGSKKQQQQSDILTNWANALVGLDHLLDLNSPSLASFCYNQSQ